MNACKAISLLDKPLIHRLLPWRLSKQLAELNEKVLRQHYDTSVLSTRPYITGLDAPHFELHMLLGHRHVGMCLWAVKSFLHFTGKRYQIVLHEDGSLTEEDIATLEKHLINVTIIKKNHADEAIKKLVGDLPNTSAFRFSYAETTNHRGSYNLYIMSLILFDMNMLSKASKRIILDADVLFFKRPDQLIDWIENSDDTRCLYSVEAFSPYKNEKHELCFGPRTPPAFNSGLLCLHESVFDLAYLETWIGNNKEIMDHPNFEQIAYEHIVKKQEGSEPLPDTYPFNNMHADAIMTHFGMKLLFFKNIQRIEHLLK